MDAQGNHSFLVGNLVPPQAKVILRSGVPALEHGAQLPQCHITLVGKGT